MYTWSDPSATPEALRPCVVTMGNFDGVHRGHQAVLRNLKRIGARLDLPTVAVTFEPHPMAILYPERAPDLIAPSRLRNDLLAEQGIDGLLVLDFTTEFAQESPDDFVRDVFCRGLDARVVVVGMDTRFGYRNSGDVGTLNDLGEALGFEVLALDDVGEEERFSSTVVRANLCSGSLGEANRILGREHRVLGTVVHGAHRGRELGYPTANLSPDAIGLVPAEGVYAGWLTRLALEPDDPEARLPAAISVGTNPTFGDDGARTVEAYVLDRTDLDLYGEEVLIEFTKLLRPMIAFDSIEELIAAMAADVQAVRDELGAATGKAGPT